MKNDYQKQWQDCLAFIRDNVGERKYDAYFSSAVFVGVSDGVLTIGLPSQWFYEMYEDNYSNVIYAAIAKAFGAAVRDVKYEIGLIQGDETSKVNLSSHRQSRTLTNPAVVQQQGPATPFEPATYADVDPQLNPSYNFENYCIGESNRLPCTIAQFIADHPEKIDFNPFFLYGDVGVGKTHLIQAIGTRIKERNPRQRVLYVTLRQFMNQFSTATIRHEQPKFINWYQSLDVLMIDDLQELSGKEGTMNVLYPIFNHLHQNGKKLIFTCDRPPVELDGITDRLIDRFKWGVTEKLPRPDRSLRKAILLNKAVRNGLDLPEEVLDHIADTSAGSVRELEGIVMSIMTRSIALNAPITLDLAREVMGTSLKMQPKKSVNFDMIVETTAERFNLSPDVIFSKTRQQDIADARQVIMYLCHKYTDLSFAAIGSKLNRRHTTVIHGVNVVQDHLETSREFSKTVTSIEEDLKLI